MSSTTPSEPLADAAMEAKMRQIWAHFAAQPDILRDLRHVLPPSRLRLGGCDFVVHPKDNHTDYIMWRDGRFPEEDALDVLMALVKGRDLTIVDVGANAGTFSLPLLQAAGPGARAIMFEPNPEMTLRLKVNIGLNSIENTSVFEIAISDKSTQSQLHFPHYGNLGQGRLNTAYENGTDLVDVDTRPLALCLAKGCISEVGLLKVDVEGMEDRVISPFLADERAPKPDWIYFETEHQTDWVYPLIDDLRHHGYHLLHDFGVNALYERGKRDGA